MIGCPPRTPVDLQAVTRDTKVRIRRVIGELEAIEQQTDPIFTQPRDVFLDMVLAQHELEAVISKLRKSWWPWPFATFRRRTGNFHRAQDRAGHEPADLGRRCGLHGARRTAGRQTRPHWQYTVQLILVAARTGGCRDLDAARAQVERALRCDSDARL